MNRLGSDHYIFISFRTRSTPQLVHGVLMSEPRIEKKYGSLYSQKYIKVWDIWLILWWENEFCQVKNKTWHRWRGNGTWSQRRREYEEIKPFSWFHSAYLLYYHWQELQGHMILYSQNINCKLWPVNSEFYLIVCGSVVLSRWLLVYASLFMLNQGWWIQHWFMTADRNNWINIFRQII